MFRHYVVHRRQTVRKCGGWLGWWSPEWAVIIGGSGDRMGVEPRWVRCRLAGSCGGGCGGGCESLPNALANRSRLNPCRSFRLSTGCILRLVGTTAVSAHRSSRRSCLLWRTMATRRCGRPSSTRLEWPTRAGGWPWILRCGSSRGRRAGRACSRLPLLTARQIFCAW